MESMHLFLFLLSCQCFLTVTDSASQTSPRHCSSFSELGPSDVIRGTNLEVRFLLYNMTGLCGQLLALNVSSEDLIKFGLNKSSLVTFIVHGYRPTGSKSVWLDDLVEQIMKVEPEAKVVVVDWNRGAATLNYYTAASNTKETAEILAKLMLQLRDFGVLPKNMHVIGASLGAHVAGMAGRSLNGTLGRISALDAAGLQFTGEDAKSRRLSKECAVFVDAYHGDTNKFGIEEQIGHIDYYLSGGEDQPGCPNTLLKPKQYIICDHQRASFYYLSSLSRRCNPQAFPCESYSAYKQGLCLNCTEVQGLTHCPRPGYHIEWLTMPIQFSSVKAYVDTGKEQPFCASPYLVKMSQRVSKWIRLQMRMVTTEGLTSLATFESSPTSQSQVVAFGGSAGFPLRVLVTLQSGSVSRRSGSRLNVRTSLHFLALPVPGH
uniref:lipase member H-like isoform X2 n=1 Tax=Myxine glutinosa TaxID=7769 RepID=UPI00358ED0D1